MGWPLLRGTNAHWVPAILPPPLAPLGPEQEKGTYVGAVASHTCSHEKETHLQEMKGVQNQKDAGLRNGVMTSLSPHSQHRPAPLIPHPSLT